MRKLTLIIMICFDSLIPLPVEAQNLPDHVPAQVLYVIDGDTFRAQIHIWPDLIIETSIRVARIDTPEKKRGSECEAERQAGYAASAYAKQFLVKNSQVFLSGLKKGKYAGRMIAEVKLADGRNFSDIMLKSGHAIAYDGGKKNKVWCR
jgi:micrococcal nuclease